MRKRGEGTIFQDRPGSPWRIQFSNRGRVVRESTGSLDRKVAEEMLKDRLAAIRSKIFVPRSRVFVEELIALVTADYQNQGQRSANNVESRWRLHLEPFFRRRRAGDINSDLLQKFVDERRREGAEPGTINRELAVLRRALFLGSRTTPQLVQTVPRFPHLKEPAARKGFLEPSQRDRLAEECGRIGLWLRAIFECAVSFGFRLHELTGHRGLRVSQLDFLSNTITLHADQTKNGCSRKVVMTGVVRELLRQCVVGKSAQDHVFTREDGSPVIFFRQGLADVLRASRMRRLALPRPAEVCRPEPCALWRRGRCCDEDQRA